MGSGRVENPGIDLWMIPFVTVFIFGTLYILAAILGD